MRLEQLFRPELPSRRHRGRARARIDRDGRRHHRIARRQRHLRRPPPARAGVRRRCTASAHAHGLHDRATRRTSASSPVCAAPEDTVLLDIESHASIYDGARLSGAQLFAFRHNSPADLARKLARQPTAGDASWSSRGCIRSAATSRRSPRSPRPAAQPGALADGGRGALVRRLRRPRARLRRSAGRPRRRGFHRRNVLEGAGGRRRLLRVEPSRR